MELVIYGLIDPRDGVVRYVGKTSDAPRRLQAHIRQPHLNVGLNRWLWELDRAQLRPEMRILRRCGTDFEAANLAEREEIARHRQQEAPLLNICDGGKSRARTTGACEPSEEWQLAMDRLQFLSWEANAMQLPLHQLFPANTKVHARLEKLRAEFRDLAEEVEARRDRLFGKQQHRGDDGV